MGMIDRAHSAWLNCGHMRGKRRRYKDFTYGRQWDDYCPSPRGGIMTERMRMEEEGRVPITNNIIRQMVKGIVGRWRYLQQGGLTPGSPLPPQTEEDARALEEFLISGMVVQRREGAEGMWRNVSPERLIFETFERADASDCRLVGMLHDMSPAEIFSRFGRGDLRRVEALRQALRGCEQRDFQLSNDMSGGLDFATPLRKGCYRIIEVWERCGSEWIEVYDPFLKSTRRELPDSLTRLQALNRARREVGSEPLELRHRTGEYWRQRWLTPTGLLLEQQTGGTPPFAIRFYPMIDGEVHSLVEDVIDQQKYVNRLISLLDHIISSSAKGVLLYPADQLPDGFTWRELRRIWSTPNGIMPYKRTAKGVSPEQVHTGSAVGAGAAEMLKTQLELFETISGNAGALRGRSTSAAGEGMLRAELENATIALLDVLGAFDAFIRNRPGEKPEKSESHEDDRD